jgi:hypothetical protein
MSVILSAPSQECDCHSLSPRVKCGLEDSLATGSGILDPVSSGWLSAGSEDEAKGDEAYGEETVGNHCSGVMGYE